MAGTFCAKALYLRRRAPRGTNWRELWQPGHALLHGGTDRRAAVVVGRGRWRKAQVMAVRRSQLNADLPLERQADLWKWVHDNNERRAGAMSLRPFRIPT